MENINIFSRNVEGMTDQLKTKSVAIAGCGGLGSNVAVALARTGIGKLIIADYDIIEYSNLNRQYYFLDDISKKKVDALEKIILNISQDIVVEKYSKKIIPEDVISIFGQADILIEAFDNAESKKWLIKNWCQKFHKKPIICGSGISGFGKTESVETKILI